EEDRKPRESGEPPPARQQLASVGENGPPTCSGRRHAKTEEAEGRFDKNCGSHSECGSYKHRSDGVWQDMPQNGSKIARAERPRRGHIIQRFCLQKLAAADSRNRRP